MPADNIKYTIGEDMEVEILYDPNKCISGVHTYKVSNDLWYFIIDHPQYKHPRYGIGTMSIRYIFDTGPQVIFKYSGDTPLKLIPYAGRYSTEGVFVRELCGEENWKTLYV